jgi:hypothetical protein
MSRTIAGIAFVYLMATLGWVFLGSTIVSRTEDQQSTLKKEVGQLWGEPLTQYAPSSELNVERTVETETWDAALKKKSIAKSIAVDKFSIPITQSDVRLDFHLDQRQKGLIWYSTYGVGFSADYIFQNILDKSGEMVLRFRLSVAGRPLR